MTDRTVLISGGGIAGPAIAFWLAAAGFRPTLIEQAPELRTESYVIDTDVFGELTNGLYVTLAGSDLSRLLCEQLKDTTEIIIGMKLSGSKKPRRACVFD